MEVESNAFNVIHELTFLIDNGVVKGRKVNCNLPQFEHGMFT